MLGAIPQALIIPCILEALLLYVWLVRERQWLCQNLLEKLGEETVWDIFVKFKDAFHFSSTQVDLIKFQAFQTNQLYLRCCLSRKQYCKCSNSYRVPNSVNKESLCWTYCWTVHPFYPRCAAPIGHTSCTLLCQRSSNVPKEFEWTKYICKIDQPWSKFQLFDVEGQKEQRWFQYLQGDWRTQSNVGAKLSVKLVGPKRLDFESVKGSFCLPEKGLFSRTHT